VKEDKEKQSPPQKPMVTFTQKPRSASVGRPSRDLATNNSSNYKVSFNNNFRRGGRYGDKNDAANNKSKKEPDTLSLIAELEKRSAIKK
jgi:hypothetical protein